jgi:hypothetical protein
MLALGVLFFTIFASKIYNFEEKDKIDDLLVHDFLLSNSIPQDEKQLVKFLLFSNSGEYNLENLLKSTLTGYFDRLILNDSKYLVEELKFQEKTAETLC